MSQACENQAHKGRGVRLSKLFSQRYLFLQMIRSCYSLWHVVWKDSVGACSHNRNETKRYMCTTSLQLVFFLRPCSSRQLHVPKTWRRIRAMKRWGNCREGAFSAGEDTRILLGQPWQNFWGFLPHVIDMKLSQSGSSGVLLEGSGPPWLRLPSFWGLL